jgi:hypothetical protein
MKYFLHIRYTGRIEVKEFSKLKELKEFSKRLNGFYLRKTETWNEYLLYPCEMRRMNTKLILGL